MHDCVLIDRSDLPYKARVSQVYPLPFSPTILVSTCPLLCPHFLGQEEVTSGLPFTTRRHNEIRHLRCFPHALTVPFLLCNKTGLHHNCPMWPAKQTLSERIMLHSTIPYHHSHPPGNGPGIKRLLKIDHHISLIAAQGPSLSLSRPV